MTTNPTSAAKRAANQQNSQRSTGPVTAEGKAKMRRNALRHGLTSKHVVIDGEDPEEFESLRQDLLTDCLPANPQELSLVIQIAEAVWRMNRARRIETETYENYFEATGLTDDPNSQAAACFHENAKFFDKLRRYSTTIDRSYYRATAELHKLQKERKKAERGSVSQNTAKPAPPEPITHPLSTQIGFVSQNAGKPLTATGSVSQEPYL